MIMLSTFRLSRFRLPGGYIGSSGKGFAQGPPLDEAHCSPSEANPEFRVPILHLTNRAIQTLSHSMNHTTNFKAILAYVFVFFYDFHSVVLLSSIIYIHIHFIITTNCQNNLFFKLAEL